MAALTLDQFAARTGSLYRVGLPGGESIVLTLRAVEPLNDSGREGGSFRLEFVGPGTPQLPQATYSFAGDDAEAIDIFIVPIAAEAEGLIYEAIFY